MILAAVDPKFDLIGVSNRSSAYYARSDVIILIFYSIVTNH